MKSRNLIPLTSAITLAFSASPLFAVTLDYVGPTGGNWNDGANWDLGSVPATNDTVTFTNPLTNSVRLDGAANTTAWITFNNGAGFSIVNGSGDTANIAHTAARTIKVLDANEYSISLTNGSGTGTSSTGALYINSTTFDIIEGGKLTLDGRYFHNPAATSARILTKSTGGFSGTGGLGTLELTGDYTTNWARCSLSAGTLLMNGTGSNARLFGMSSVGVDGTLLIGSSNTNFFTGTASDFSPASAANTGIRLISGLVDLNGFDLATTHLQGTGTTGVITNNGSSDSILTLGDFGADTGISTTYTQPVFNGIIQDGSTNKLGLTLTGGSGDKLAMTLGQAPTYTGPTVIENGASLITPGLAGGSPIAVGAGSTLVVDGALANTAGITVEDGTLDIRGALSSSVLTVSGGMVKTSPSATTGIPVDSISQTGGSIELAVIGNSANKLISTGNMTFAGGSLTAVLNSGPTAPVVLAEYGSLTGTPTVTFSPDLATTRLNSPVVDAITDNKVTLSLGGSVADLVWTGAADAQWNLTNVNWNNGGSGSAFFNLDKVAFTDAPAIKTINLVETVTPGKMSVTSLGLNDYTFDGTGGIGGLAEGLVKNGDAWLNLGGDNTFTGPVQVNDGALILIKPQALGFTSGVTVASGGQLDVYGQLLTDSNRSYNATISGDGDGTGAIVNSSTISTISGITGKSGLRNLTLAADASVGGSGIFDIGTGGAIDGGGFTLTKKGDGRVMLNGPVTNISTVIESGDLSTTLDDGFGPTLLVKANGTAGNPRTSGGYIHNTSVTVESGGTLKSNTSVDWNGNFVAEGNLNIEIDQVTSATMSFPNAVSIPGNLVSKGAASGGTTSFLGDLNVSGTITMTTGTLSFDGSTGNLNAAAIVLSGGTTSLIFNRSSDMSFDNIISGSGGIRQLGTGTTTLNGNNTYAGSSATTNVGAGTLLVNGIQTSGANVSVSSGATLGGIGTMPAAVTVTGTLAPGGPGIGTFYCGTSTKPATINGTLRIKYDGSATDSLDVAGAITLGESSVIDFDQMGSPLTEASYIIASYDSTLTGTFGTVTDLPSGYSLVYDYDNGETTTNIALVATGATPYSTWIDSFFMGESDLAIIGPDADPDKDGESNAVEFALGGTPNDGSSNAKIYSLAMDSDDDGTESELLLTIAVRSGTPVFAGSPSPAATQDGFTTSIQGTLDLSAFDASVSVVAPLVSGLPTVPVGYEYRTFRLDGSNGLPSKGFLRVQVSE